MIKKSRWPYYLRWLSLSLALVLLFVGLLLGEGHLPPFGSALREKRSEIPAEPLQFAFLSDSHKGWGVLMPIMKEIVRDGYAFAIHGGDLVAQSRDDRYRFFFRELAEVKGKPPLYFVPGNHDAYDKGNHYSLKNFHTYCGPDYYWFAHGNSAFVVLNDAQSTISEGQFRWLEGTLLKLRGAFTHIFVFMHVPPFDPREGRSYCLSQGDGGRFMSLMEKYRVAIVFSGHIHCYFRTVVKGVTYIISPSAGGTPRCSPSFYGYVRMTVNKEGIKDSVVAVKHDWWLQLRGDIQYELGVRSPFLLPLTVVMGQPFLYLFAA
jgi:predicted phosphodiesterase